MRAALLLLIPVLVFPELLIVTGSSLGKGPFLSLLTVFETNYTNLKSLTEFELGISISGGNLFFDASNLDDSVKTFQMDIGKIQLSYGYLRPSFHVPGSLSKEEWLLKVDRSYVIFSNKPRIWVDMSPFYVKAGKRDRAIGFIPSFRDFGAGFILENNRRILAVNLNGLFLKLSRNMVEFSLYKPNIVVSFTKGELTVFLWNENGYVQIGEDGTKFLERVGYIYAVGKLSKREQKIGIGFRF